jgi:hypothetical protein
LAPVVDTGEAATSLGPFTPALEELELLPPQPPNISAAATAIATAATRLPASATTRNEVLRLTAMNAPRRLYAGDLANGEKFLQEEDDALSGQLLLHGVGGQDGGIVDRV